MSVMQPELKTPAPDQELNLARHNFGKKNKKNLNSPVESVVSPASNHRRASQEMCKILGRFIEIAWDHSVISWISADLSCSAATLPCFPEEIISCTKSTTFPLDGKPLKLLKRSLIHTSVQPRGYWGFTNYECD